MLMLVELQWLSLIHWQRFDYIYMCENKMNFHERFFCTITLQHLPSRANNIIWLVIVSHTSKHTLNSVNRHHFHVSDGKWIPLISCLKSVQGNSCLLLGHRRADQVAFFLCLEIISKSEIVLCREECFMTLWVEYSLYSVYRWQILCVSLKMSLFCLYSKINFPKKIKANNAIQKWAEDLSKLFSNDDIHMADRAMKNCSI